MGNKSRLFLLIGSLLLWSPLLHADDREITIDIIEDPRGTPETVTGTIELPAPSDQQALQQKRRRDNNRERGQQLEVDAAQQVRDRVNLGEEFGDSPVDIPPPDDSVNATVPEEAPSLPTQEDSLSLPSSDLPDTP